MADSVPVESDDRGDWIAYPLAGIVVASAIWVGLSIAFDMDGDGRGFNTEFADKTSYLHAEAVRPSFAGDEDFDGIPTDVELSPPTSWHGRFAPDPHRRDMLLEFVVIANHSSVGPWGSDRALGRNLTINASALLADYLWNERRIAVHWALTEIHSEIQNWTTHRGPAADSSPHAVGLGEHSHDSHVRQVMVVPQSLNDGEHVGGVAVGHIPVVDWMDAADWLDAENPHNEVSEAVKKRFSPSEDSTPIDDAALEMASEKLRDVMLHELGHVLGLCHAHLDECIIAFDSSEQPFANTTVMSYERSWSGTPLLAESQWRTIDANLPCMSHAGGTSGDRHLYDPSQRPILDAAPYAWKWVRQPGCAEDLYSFLEVRAGNHTVPWHDRWPGAMNLVYFTTADLPIAKPWFWLLSGSSGYGLWWFEAWRRGAAEH